MKTGIIVSLVAMAATSGVLAGTVVFSPPGYVTCESCELPLTFQVSVRSSELTTIRSFDLVIGSNDPLRIDGFTFAPSIQNGFPLNAILSPASPPVYLDDISIGGFGFTPVNSTDLLLGTLHVTKPPIPGGYYYIEVNAQLDNNRSVLGGVTGAEPLFGRATVTAVPEPATMMLLALGALAVARPRRAYCVPPPANLPAGQPSG